MRWRATYLPVNMRHGVKVADRYLLATFAINKKSCFLRGGLWEFDGYKPVNDFDKKISLLLEKSKDSFSIVFGEFQSRKWKNIK